MAVRKKYEKQHYLITRTINTSPPCGTITLVAPCCGARYAYPNYTYMNFSAWAYWTDG